MSLEASFQSHRLVFKFAAGTSRGVLKKRDTYLLKVWDSQKKDRVGVGEASPLEGLSPEFHIIEKELSALCESIKHHKSPHSNGEIYDLLNQLVSSSLPSLRFALEIALLDLNSKSSKELFPGPFIQGKKSIPINGLVWMGDFDFMKEQIDMKFNEGYRCIKMKIGAIGFEQECKLLEYIRKTYGPEITLRVDANGAFTPEEAKLKLVQLSQYNLHSIEQPVKSGQTEIMKQLCNDPAVPIALDEELIGIHDLDQKAALLDTIQPQYIVLKPTLLGGIKATNEWIRMAEARDIGWWITSALESNIGLNALAQFTASLNVDLPQGLGTGQLYENNLPGKLQIEHGRLLYKA